ncbi:Outer membrane protein PagN precursor [Labrenzia sp. THAF82]|uniref:outer membrane protein n=1 Tax=Labrenzia sp. THAF82 TaxID=2587861 RepID=UPI0012AA6630|nr:outer membrane beta-barrel protein [Labrenzia sp. THAF82]QFT29495.1 Outer membrane protein PagN precursor [Labrenzia sp. THAF82]
MREIKNTILFIVFSAYCSPVYAESVFLNETYLRSELGTSIGARAGETQLADDAGFFLPIDDFTLGTGRTFGLAVGTRLCKSIRTEALFQYRQGHSFDPSLQDFLGLDFGLQADVSSYSLMLGGIYDVFSFDVGNLTFTPNVAGFVGLSHNRTGDLEVSVGTQSVLVEGDSKTDFAWGLGGGLAIGLTNNVSLDLSYRYMDLGKFEGGTLSRSINEEFTQGFDGNYTTQDLMFGIRYTF